MQRSLKVNWVNLSDNFFVIDLKFPLEVDEQFAHTIMNRKDKIRYRFMF